MVNIKPILKDPINRKKAVEARKKRGGYNNSLIGRKHSEEAKLKMSKSSTGENNSQYGSIWITNGVECKKIKKDDSVPKGWRRGRK